jgi:hypothetical protein
MTHEPHEHVHLGFNECSELAEQNACHRKLVHHDESAECAHDAHVSSDAETCKLCALAPISYSTWIQAHIGNPFYAACLSVITRDYQDALVSEQRLANGSRGPPDA